MTSNANAPLPRGQAGLAAMARNRQIKTAAAAALPRPLAFIDTAYKKHKGSHKFLVFTNPSAANADYPSFVRTALANTWQLLKPLWQKGFRARMAIDFKDRSAQGLPSPPWVTDNHSTVVYDLVDKERTQELLEYWTHDVTSLEAPHSEAERIVRSLDQMLALAVPHLANRVALEMHYNELDALQQTQQQPLFRTPVHLIISVWRTAFDRAIPIGDRGSHILLERLLTQNDAPPGDCVFQAMVDQFAKQTPPISDTIQQIREKCGHLHGGVSMDDLTKIEEAYSWKGNQADSEEHQLGFVLFDCRLNLRRLPPYTPPDNNNNTLLCKIVVSDGHAYGFQRGAEASNLMLRGISYFEAVIRAASEEEEGTGGEPPRKKSKTEHDPTYILGYNLFRATQHLQPDTGAITERLNKMFGRDVNETVALSRVKAGQRAWKTLKEKPTRPIYIKFIEAKGLDQRLRKLGHTKTDNAMIELLRPKILAS